MRGLGLNEAVAGDRQIADDESSCTPPTTETHTGLRLSKTETATAKTLLRTVTLADLDLDWLAAEIEYWNGVAARYRADLAAGEFADGEWTALSNGIAHAELRQNEALHEGEQRLRIQQRLANPQGPTATWSHDLAARFAAARYCDLVDLVQTLTGTTATKSGRDRWTIRCPFHAGGEERTPSFVIYPPGKGWHCFGCGRGGDAVAFVMELMDIGAVSALVIVEQLMDTWPEAWNAKAAR
jgi:hypothetical protein